MTKSKRRPASSPGKSDDATNSTVPGSSAGRDASRTNVAAVMGFSLRETRASWRVKRPLPQPSSSTDSPGKRCTRCRKL